MNKILLGMLCFVSITWAQVKGIAELPLGTSCATARDYVIKNQWGNPPENCASWQLPDAKILGQRFAVSLQFGPIGLKGYALVQKQSFEASQLSSQIRAMLQVLQGQWGVPNKGLASDVLDAQTAKASDGAFIEIAQWSQQEALYKLATAKMNGKWTLTLSAAHVPGLLLKQ
jgi:hypothetical protein